MPQIGDTARVRRENYSERPYNALKQLLSDNGLSANGGANTLLERARKAGLQLPQHVRKHYSTDNYYEQENTMNAQEIKSLVAQAVAEAVAQLQPQQQQQEKQELGEPAFMVESRNLAEQGKPLGAAQVLIEHGISEGKAWEQVQKWRTPEEAYPKHNDLSAALNSMNQPAQETARQSRNVIDNTRAEGEFPQYAGKPGFDESGQWLKKFAGNIGGSKAEFYIHTAQSGNKKPAFLLDKDEKGSLGWGGTDRIFPHEAMWAIRQISAAGGDPAQSPLYHFVRWALSYMVIHDRPLLTAPYHERYDDVLALFK